MMHDNIRTDRNLLDFDFDQRHSESLSKHVGDLDTLFSEPRFEACCACAWTADWLTWGGLDGEKVWVVGDRDGFPFALGASKFLHASSINGAWKTDTKVGERIVIFRFWDRYWTCRDDRQKRQTI